MATIPEIEGRIHALWAKGDARTLEESVELGRLLTALETEMPPGDFYTHVLDVLYIPARAALYATVPRVPGGFLLTRLPRRHSMRQIPGHTVAEPSAAIEAEWCLTRTHTRRERPWGGSNARGGIRPCGGQYPRC